ncbi:MAG: HAD-IA family hydrolase [Planctomycetota bacterium]
MQRPGALLIDFGGTLAAEAASRAELYAEAGRRHGADVRADAMEHLMREAHDSLPVVHEGAFRYSHRWFERFIELIFGERLGMSSEALDATRQDLFARFSDAATFRVFPGSRELIGAARRSGAPVALVSNWSDALPALVRDLGLEFDAILCSAIERSEKPEAAIFERALERVGTRARDAIHVGDSIANDVEGARAVGIESVLVDRRGRRADFEGRRVRRLDELVALFD